MTDTKCPRCARTMDATGSICRRCQHTLEVSLANVAAYWADLDTLRTGQVRYGSGAGAERGRGEAPLAMDARFAKGATGATVEVAVRNTVTTWTRYVLEHTQRPAAGPACVDCRHGTCRDIRRARPPRDTIASCCAFLARYSDWIRVCPVGDQVLRDLLDIERALARLIDRPADRWFAGTCGGLTISDDRIVRCERQLYVEPGEQLVRCGDCGSTYDVAERREALLAEAEDREATVETIARIVTTLGDAEVSRERIAGRIRLWAHRGRIQSHGARVVDGKARPLYRVGDVLDKLAEDARHADKKPKREAS